MLSFNVGNLLISNVDQGTPRIREVPVQMNKVHTRGRPHHYGVQGTIRPIHVAGCPINGYSWWEGGLMGVVKRGDVAGSRGGGDCVRGKVYIVYTRITIYIYMYVCMYLFINFQKEGLAKNNIFFSFIWMYTAGYGKKRNFVYKGPNN